MLYREIIAVCSQIHTKHINTLCGQNVEFFIVRTVVSIETTTVLVFISQTPRVIVMPPVHCTHTHTHEHTHTQDALPCHTTFAAHKQ